MSLLSLGKVTLRLSDLYDTNQADTVILEDSDVSLEKDVRYALVGPNGTGKSTLLKYLVGKLKEIDKVDFLYIDQVEPLDHDTQTVLDFLLRARKALYLKHQEYEELQEVEDLTELDCERMVSLEEELTREGWDRFQSEAHRVLNGLGFRDQEQREARELSGGWRMRLCLARALLRNPRMLLLDECETYLDLLATVWLTDYLSTWTKGLLIISHDVEFVDCVANVILFVDDHKLRSFRGGYGKFKKQLKMEREGRVKAWELAVKAHKRNKQSETKKVVPPRPPKEYEVKVEFLPVPALEGRFISLEDVSFGYGSDGTILEEVDCGVSMGDHLVLVGENGAGKSTLMKLLLGELNPTHGTAMRDTKVRVGYFNQLFMESMPSEATAMDYLVSVARHRDTLKEQDYRKCLGTIGLTADHHSKRIGSLSGGQKARLAFAAIALGEPHVLFLDEPTSACDVEAIEGLIKGINAFPGGVVIITHCVHLIKRTGCVILEVAGKKVTPWRGSVNEWIHKILSS